MYNSLSNLYLFIYMKYTIIISMINKINKNENIIQLIKENNYFKLNNYI